MNHTSQSKPQANSLINTVPLARGWLGFKFDLSVIAVSSRDSVRLAAA
jgi:hypothetical protein